MTIDWRAARSALHPFVIGFVERHDETAPGAAIELPFAIPVIHIALDGDVATGIEISGGARSARAREARATRRTFVVALGFGGVAHLSPMATPALVDRFATLDAAPWRDLRDRLCEASDFAARVMVAETVLMRWIDAADPPTPVLRAADAIAHDRFIGPVHDLARRFGMEERTLRNRFRRELGWSPKRLLRVARFNRALRAIHPHPWIGPPRHDIRLEFFDDAHLYHEFRALAGISPAGFAAVRQRDGDQGLQRLSVEALPRDHLPGRERTRIP